MKILFISALFPIPCDIAAKIRIFNMIKQLKQKGNDISLIAFNKPENVEASKKLKNDYFNTMEVFPAPKESTERIPHADTTIKEKILRLTQDLKPDVIISNMITASTYVPFELGIPSISDHHNCEYMILTRENRNKTGLEKITGGLELYKVTKAEKKLLSRFNKIFVVSESDKYYLEKHLEKEIIVLPNAIDTSLYDINEWQPNPNKLIYTGSIDIEGNYDAIKHYKENIMPVLIKKSPEAVLYVTGKSSDNLNREIFDNKNIISVGYVNDMVNIYKDTQALIIPITSGTSARFKIIEAMAAGVPVVSTTLGCEGLGATDRENILIANSPEKITEHIVALQENKSLADNLRHNAREFIDKQYSWNAIGPKFISEIATI